MPGELLQCHRQELRANQSQVHGFHVLSYPPGRQGDSQHRASNSISASEPTVYWGYALGNVHFIQIL